MSSLRIQGTLSCKSTATGYLANQSQCSVSLWFKANTILPNGTGFLWSQSQVPLLIQSGAGGGGKVVCSWLYGQGTALGNTTYSAPYTLSYWHHVAWSWDAAGKQLLYLDGVIVNGRTDAGMTKNQASALNLGTTAAGAADFQLARAAVWHGHALTGDEITALLYGTATEAALGAQTLWTLQGAPGTSPDPRADAAFLDAIGGSVRYGAFTGTGTASYAVDSPGFVSPQSVSDARTGKSGQTVFLLPLFKTASVSTQPTFTVNGNPVAATPGPADGGFWCWSLATAVAATDAIHVTAPAKWSGSAPALDIPVRNLLGRCEFPITTTRTLELGYNIGLKPLADDQNWCPCGNWWRRMRSWNWQAVVVTGFDAVGNPTQFAPGRKAVHGTFSTSSTPIGLWMLAYDSLDGGATTLDLVYQNAPRGPVYHPELSDPVGKEGIGIFKVYDVSAGGALVQISHSAGTPRFANAQLLPPGNPASADPLQPEAAIVSYMDLGGGRGPATIRPMDSCFNAGGQSWMAQGSDLPGITPASWTSSGAITTASLTAIRPLDTSISPALIDPGGTSLSWLSPPTKMLWGNNTYTVECVCATPHGLTTGQFCTITLNVPSVSVAGVASPIPITGPFGALIYVTSPTTFVYIGVSGLLKGARSNLAIEQTLTGATAQINPRGGSASPTSGAVIFPPEFFARLASTWSNTYLWVNMPIAATNSYIDAVAARIAPYRCKVILEYPNEAWNSNFGQWYVAFTLNQLKQTFGMVEGYQVRRSLEIAARFRSAFLAAGRPSSDVLSSLMGWWGQFNGPLIDAAIAAFRNGQGSFDVLGVAPYIDLSNSDATMTGWSPAMALDLMRHFLVLDATEIGRRADFQAGVARYEAAIGRRVVRGCYEGGIQSVACLTRSPYTQYVSAWDWMYHPDMVDTEHVLYTLLQDAGMDILTIYTFLFAGPNSLGLNWASYCNQQQGPGPGLGNTFAQAYVPGNESVRGYAHRQWAVGAPG